MSLYMHVKSVFYLMRYPKDPWSWNNYRSIDPIISNHPKVPYMETLRKTLQSLQQLRMSFGFESGTTLYRSLQYVDVKSNHDPWHPLTSWPKSVPHAGPVSPRPAWNWKMSIIFERLWLPPVPLCGVVSSCMFRLLWGRNVTGMVESHDVVMWYGMVWCGSKHGAKHLQNRSGTVLIHLWRWFPAVLDHRHSVSPVANACREIITALPCGTCVKSENIETS